MSASIITYTSARPTRVRVLQYLLQGCCGIGLLVAGDLQAANAHPLDDLSGIAFEQLVQMEVLTASRLARQVSDAPSAVSIVTAEDIRDFGYRSLSEILGSMRGLNITSDRVYDFIGGRGYGRPGDYTGRIMLLIDGHQANDGFYNQSYLGSDGQIDVELIERVEYVSGPGSVAYGNNAFYGIINVITKKGGTLNGGETALSAGSYESYKGRVSYGKQLQNGLDVLVSASGFDSDGQSFNYPELGGRSVNQDEQRTQRLFGKVGSDKWQVLSGYSERKKYLPTTPYGAILNADSYYQDTNYFLSGHYHADLAKHLKLSLQSDYGRYLFRNRSTYDLNDGNVIEKNDAAYWSVDAKFATDLFNEHKLVFGMAYRNDFRREYSSLQYQVELDEGRENWSLFVQDEIALRNNLWINLGLRYDRFSDHDGSDLSPRAALIYQPAQDYMLKLSHSYASRTPTAAEKYYTDTTTYFSNPDLDKEKVGATELVLERRWGNYARLLASVYTQHTEDTIIGAPYDSGYVINQNAGDTNARGIDLSYEHGWSSGIRLRTSYAFQLAEDDIGHTPTNAPKHLAKFNLVLPLPQHIARLGLELQSTSARKTEAGERLGGYTLANLTITREQLLRNMEASFSVRNLLDKDYKHVAPDYNAPLDAIEQDGRNFWLQLTYRFR